MSAITHTDLIAALDRFSKTFLKANFADPTVEFESLVSKFAVYSQVTRSMTEKIFTHLSKDQIDKMHITRLAENCLNCPLFLEAMKAYGKTNNCPHYVKTCDEVAEALAINKGKLSLNNKVSKK